MLADLIRSKNLTLQKAVSEAVSEGLRHEMSNLQKLEGEKLKSFIDMFSIQSTTEPEVYYNNFNMVFCEPDLHDEIKNFLKADTLAVRIEIPKTNINLWCYEIFADPLFSNIFDDLEPNV